MRVSLPVLALAGALLAGCQQKNEFQPPPPPTVTVAQPVEEQIVDYFQTTGQTRSVNTVDLRAQVSGYLQQITFKDGDMVKQGDLLFVIDKAPYEAALASAAADVAKAEAQLRLATAQLGRAESLVARKAATKDQLDEAEAQKASAAADVAAAKAAVRKAELDLGFTEIRAPFSGRVGEHQVDVGNLVSIGTTLLATIESVDPIHAYFNIGESDYLKLIESGLITAESTASVPIEMALGERGRFEYRGRLDYGEFGVDPSTGTTLRRAVFENQSGTLVPGLFVRVQLAVSEPKPRLLVEERAVSSDQRGDFLLVVNEENKVEYRSVRLGPANRGLRVIEEGIQKGDWVVINGLQRARPDSEVAPAQTEMTPIPGAETATFRFLPDDPAVAEHSNK